MIIIVICQWNNKSINLHWNKRIIWLLWPQTILRVFVYQLLSQSHVENFSIIEFFDWLLYEFDTKLHLCFNKHDNHYLYMLFCHFGNQKTKMMNSGQKDTFFFQYCWPDVISIKWLTNLFKDTIFIIWYASSARFEIFKYVFFFYNDLHWVVATTEISMNFTIYVISDSVLT